MDVIILKGNKITFMNNKIIDTYFDSEFNNVDKSNVSVRFIVRDVYNEHNKLLEHKVLELQDTIQKGGEGSGNFNHGGRPGEIGGSSTETVYHGTTLDRADKIIVEGLISGKYQNFEERDYGWSWGLNKVFVTKNRDHAIRMASLVEARLTNDKKTMIPVVIKIEIPEEEFKTQASEDVNDNSHFNNRDNFMLDRVDPKYIKEVAGINDRTKLFYKKNASDNNIILYIPSSFCRGR